MIVSMARPGRVVAVVATVLVFASCHRTRDPLPGFPNLMLWAWERPEDLRFLDPAHAGVALLAATVTLNGPRVYFRPRMQPLRVNPGTKLMAVVRIDSSGPPAGDPELVAARILDAVRMPDISALQIDYDARASERAFYRDIVHRVRARLPASMPLTMTALVSWCASDNWIAGLPVAEAVPMYFRMGPEPHRRRASLRSPLCDASTGLSTDELVRIPLHRRVYLFHPRPWTREACRNAVSEVNRWR